MTDAKPTDFITLSAYLAAHPEYFLTKYQVLEMEKAGKIPTECYLILNRLKRKRYLVHEEKFNTYIKKMIVGGSL